MVNRYVNGTKIVLLGFDSASESHQSPVPSFRRSKACPVPRYGAGIERGRVAPTTPKHFQRPGPIFIPWCAGTSRHERLVRKHVPDSDPGWTVPATEFVIPAFVGIPSHSSFRPLNSSFPRRREPGEAYGWQMTRTQLLQSAPRFSYLRVPAPAGISDCYESMSQTPIRDRPFQQPLIGHSRHPLVTPAPRFVIPANACPVPRYGAGIQRGRGEGIVALGLVPSLGRAARSRTLHRPAHHHFHPLMRPSQGHGDSGESTSRTPIRGRNPEGQGKGKTAQRRGKT